MAARLVDDDLKSEFRKGFYPGCEAAWIERVANEPDEVKADIAGCLSALKAGQRDFSYPRHDKQVFDILHRIVPANGLKRGADIGCATGCFPAMQLSAGIERCTVFEVRATDVNDARVDVRVEDLTYARELEPEFDLVTCLSTIEHVGLGRYGDPIDPWGDLKMAANLRRLLRPGGIMLLSFPVGRGCVVFNRNRIYSPDRQAALVGDLKLVDWASGRSRLGYLRGRVQVAVGRAETVSQPILVLQKSLD